ncbi:MAG: hypothetical protein HYV07_01100 [Deltaproteobacteria bacterium]|nr:hypothetical protein [Deltaproteobacteria bacterium]
MRGRAIILASGTTISPFGDHAREMWFAGETIAQTQDRAFAHVGFEVVRAADPKSAIDAAREALGRPVILMLDRIYVSEKALRDFLKTSEKTGAPSALALSINASVEYTLPLQDIRRDGDTVVHDVVRIDGAKLPETSTDPVAFMHEVRDAARICLVPKREIVVEVPLPVIGERDQAKMRYPITSTIVVSIEHWIHVLELNQISFGILWMELIRRRPVWALSRALSAFSWSFDRILMRMVARGRNVRIHPTAHVSASILGDEVVVGAHVTVKNSFVGAGTVLSDHAVLLNTVIGPKSLVTENTFLVSCASFPEVSVGNYKLQVSLIGRGAYINAWASFVDARFDGHVKVSHRGQLVSSERSFLGSVIGHRAKMASKVLIQPGREIPNDTIVVMRPDEVVSIVPRDLPAGVPLVRDCGTLVPLGKESK